LGKDICRRSQGFYSWIFKYISEDMLIKKIEDNAMYVEHITVDEFKKKLTPYIDQLNYHASSILCMIILEAQF
jgi:hypothetical protein